MATSRKSARATNETLSQLQPAFVFNLHLGSRSVLANPAAPLVNRVVAHTHIGAIGNSLPRRLAGVHTLGVGVSRRYQTFRANLGPLNRAVRYRRQPVSPADTALWDSDSYADFDSFDYAEPAPVAREYAAPLQGPRPSVAIEPFATAPFFQEQSFEPAPASPLATQVASFEPVIVRGLAAIGPTTNPAMARPAHSVENQNLATPAQPTALQRNFARLETAEATEALISGSTTSADLTRPAALSLNYYGPGRWAAEAEPATTDNLGYDTLSQPSFFGSSAGEIARAYQQSDLAAPSAATAVPDLARSNLISASAQIVPNPAVSPASVGNVAGSARPAVGSWNHSLAVLQTNPALTINRWLTDQPGEPSYAIEPGMNFNYYRPGRRPAAEAAPDPVSRLMSDFSPAEFSPTAQRSQAILIETVPGQPQVVNQSRPPVTQFPLTLPGTGLVDQALTSSVALTAQTNTSEAVPAQSFNNTLGQSARPLMRALERAESLNAASASYQPDEAAFGLPLTYAQPGQRRVAPASNEEGASGSAENKFFAQTVARLYEPALVAQEVSARLEQTSRGPGHLTSLQALPGFEAVANDNPFEAVSVAPGWNGRLAALQANPGVAARRMVAPAEDRAANWDTPAELNYAQPGQRRRPEAASLDSEENPAEPALTSLERNVLRTLTSLGSEQEVGQRLAALVSQTTGARASGGSPFAADRPAGQLGTEREASVQRFFDSASASGSLVARLSDQNLPGSPMSSDFGAADLNYVTPPLTLRKAARPAPDGEGAELAENQALANFLSSLGISAAPAFADPRAAQAEATPAIERTFEPQPPARPANDGWDDLALNYANPISPVESRPVENPFAFNPGVLSGLNLATQTRRTGSTSAEMARLPLVQRQSVSARSAEVSPIDLFGEAGDVSELATHFETPFDQPIGVIGHPQPPMIQRKASGQAATGSARSFERVLNTSVGQSLDKTVQRRLEPVFNTSFEHVRVHTGNAASEYTSQMGAEAFTVGSDIFFAPGRYQPHTPEGQSLIGHELTHVVQQANLPSLGGGRIPETSAQGQAFEHEALGNERLLLRHLSNSQPDSSSMRVSGETHLNLGDATSSFSPSNSGTVQRSYRPVEPVHLQESAPATHAEPTLGSTVERVIDPPAQQSATHSGSNGEHSADKGPKVEEIAEQVYRLLRQRLLVERERGGPSGGRFF